MEQRDAELSRIAELEIRVAELEAQVGERISEMETQLAEQIESLERRLDELTGEADTAADIDQYDSGEA